MKNRLRPNAPASQPVIGRTIALETRYEVSTQVLWSLLAPRFPAMYGSATLAMLVSRTSMNAARATTTATNHGLYRGRQISWSSVSAAVVIQIHVWNYIHAWTELSVPIFSRLEDNFYRHSLHNLHVISGGIFGRKQTEQRPGCAGDAVNVAVQSSAA